MFTIRRKDQSLDDSKSGELSKKPSDIQSTSVGKMSPNILQPSRAQQVEDLRQEMLSIARAEYTRSRFADKLSYYCVERAKRAADIFRDLEFANLTTEQDNDIYTKLIELDSGLSNNAEITESSKIEIIKQFKKLTSLLFGTMKFREAATGQLTILADVYVIGHVYRCELVSINQKGSPNAKREVEVKLREQKPDIGRKIYRLTLTDGTKLVDYTDGLITKIEIPTRRSDRERERKTQSKQKDEHKDTSNDNKGLVIPAHYSKQEAFLVRMQSDMIKKVLSKPAAKSLEQDNEGWEIVDDPVGGDPVVVNAEDYGL